MLPKDKSERAKTLKAAQALKKLPPQQRREVLKTELAKRGLTTKA
jgi:DNA-directed RNA polymerase specialized sigma24 family protein